VTFVLNLLHSKFAILATDLRAAAPRGGTVSIGNMTIKTVGQLNIDGFQKMAITSDRLCAVAMSGSVQAHTYFKRIPELEWGAAIDEVREWGNSWTTIARFRERVAEESQMEQCSIATFLDPETERFSSYMACGVPGAITANWYTPKNATLLHVGSGGANFEKAMTLEVINQFLEQLKEVSDPAAVQPWLADAFTKVSSITPDCSAQFSAKLATLAEATFRDWVVGGGATQISHGQSPPS